MLIAQITDLHLSASGDIAARANGRRFDQVAEAVKALDVAPDLVVATGDLVEDGSIESYELLRDKLADLPFEVKLCLGNHDERASFQEVFGEQDFVDGYLHYALDYEDFRVLVLDTLQPGQHGGGFDETRSNWLTTQLGSAHKPTLIALHHPPIPTNIPWMTAHEDEPWVTRLEASIVGQDHVVGLISGHVHRPIHRPWAGTHVVVSAASAGQVVLNMSPIDPDHADGRALINDEPPGFSLHYWDGKALTTHRMVAGKYNTLASYGPTMEGAMQSVFNVRKG